LQADGSVSKNSLEKRSWILESLQPLPNPRNVVHGNAPTEPIGEIVRRWPESKRYRQTGAANTPDNEARRLRFISVAMSGPTFGPVAART